MKKTFDMIVDSENARLEEAFKNYKLPGKKQKTPLKAEPENPFEITIQKFGLLKMFESEGFESQSVVCIGNDGTFWLVRPDCNAKILTLPQTVSKLRDWMDDGTFQFGSDGGFCRWLEIVESNLPQVEEIELRARLR